jgi:hypothetical protein
VRLLHGDPTHGWSAPTAPLVEAWRTQGDAAAYARRDDIRRRGLDAQRRAERGREPWAIETALHGGREIAFREDDSRLRTGHAPEHFARLRPRAGPLRRHEQTSRHGVQVKRNRAGWDHDSLLTV